MIAVFSLLTFIIIILGISYVIYYLIYSRSINNRLKNNESQAHNSMVPVDTVGKFFSIVACVLIIFILFGELNGLKSDIEGERVSLSSQISDLEWRISELQNELQKQNSLVSGFEYTVEKFDPLTRMVDVEMTCMPKRYSEDTHITMINGDKTIEFTNDGNGIFTAVETFSAFDSFDYETIVCQEDQGMTQTCMEEELLCGYLYEGALPHLGYGDWTESEIGPGKCKVKGNIYFDEDQISMDQLELYVVKNGERQYDLNVELPETIYEAEVKAGRDDEILIVLRGVDQYELEHRKVIGAIGEHVEDYYFDGGDTIYDADGNLLVGVEIPY